MLPLFDTTLITAPAVCPCCASKLAVSTLNCCTESVGGTYATRGSPPDFAFEPVPGHPGPKESDAEAKAGRARYYGFGTLALGDAHYHFYSTPNTWYRPPYKFVGAKLVYSPDAGRTWRVAETPIAGGTTGGVFGGLALTGGRAVIVGGDHKDELRASPNIALSDGRGWADRDASVFLTLQEERAKVEVRLPPG